VEDKGVYIPLDIGAFFIFVIKKPKIIFQNNYKRKKEDEKK